METEPPSPEGAVRASVEYRFATPLPDSVDLLLLSRGRTVSDLEHAVRGGWEQIRVWRGEDGSLRGRAPLQGDRLRVRWTVLDAFVFRGPEAALDLPIPAPISADNGALPDRFGILVRGDRRYDVRRPFPSNLRYDDSGAGAADLVGDAPVVPGVVRFGDPSLLADPAPPEAGGPGEAQPGQTRTGQTQTGQAETPDGTTGVGWPFWGLWFALAGLLVAYGVWMAGRERIERSDAADDDPLSPGAS
jgi:hypothetical protein